MLVIVLVQNQESGREIMTAIEREKTGNRKVEEESKLHFKIHVHENNIVHVCVHVHEWK